jgi:prepilin-type N-terminal cleavage/methylation domain-containing protein
MPSLNSKFSDSASKGFSLLELMIAMTIVLIMLAVLASILAGVNYQFRTQRPRLESLNNAQTAVDTVIRLIRMAGNRPVNCLSTFQVSAPAASDNLGNQYFGKLRIQSDWNPSDCTLNGIEEDVTFSVKDGVLYIDANQQVPFVDKVSAVRFEFFDKNNTVIPNPQVKSSDIARIQVEVDTLPIDGTFTTVSSSASIRK